MASSPLLILSLLSLLVALPRITTPIDTSDSFCSDHTNNLICELQDMKLKISQLESVLEQSTQNINTKVQIIEQKVQLVEEMTHKIDSLQTSLTNIKGESTAADERIDALEEEVRILWAVLRKNNFDIHILESNARDAEVRLKKIVTKVEQIGNIVTEQWIQIRQLDQALLVTEMRTSKVLRKAGYTKCTFLKFLKGLSGHHIPELLGGVEQRLFGKRSVTRSYASQALHQLKKTALAAKRYHHELQAFVKKGMEMNEFTAILANQEVVFFVASALITFPIFSAWMLLMSHFS